MGDNTVEKELVRAIRKVVAGERPVDPLTGLHTETPTNHTGIGLLLALLTAYFYGTPAHQEIALGACLQFLRTQRTGGHMAWLNDDEWLSDSHSIWHYVYALGMEWASLRFGLSELRDECRWWMSAHVAVCLLHREPGPGPVRKWLAKLVPHKAPHIATAGFRTHVGGVQADWRTLRDQIIALVLGEPVNYQKDTTSEGSTGLWFLLKIITEYPYEMTWLRDQIEHSPLPVPRVMYVIERGADWVRARFAGDSYGGWRPADWVFFSWGKKKAEDYGAVPSWGKFTRKHGNEPDVPPLPALPGPVRETYKLRPPR